jgi:hypothetical protein
MTNEAPPPKKEYAANLADGAQVRVTSYEDGVLGLICDRAHPPGRPLQLHVPVGEGAVVLLGKSAGSKRREDQRFDVRLRLHSLRREDRLRLEGLFEKA